VTVPVETPLGRPGTRNAYYRIQTTLACDTIEDHSDVERRHIEAIITRVDRTIERVGDEFPYYADPDTGELQSRYNELAHSDETCWARGQGWNIAGLALAYDATGAERYLGALKATTDYYVDHSPNDLVPYWDFEDREIPEAPRDTSAATLAAYGLRSLDDASAAAAELHRTGATVLSPLVDDYLILDATDDRYGMVTLQLLQQTRRVRHRTRDHLDRFLRRRRHRRGPRRSPAREEGPVPGLAVTPRRYWNRRFVQKCFPSPNWRTGHLSARSTV